MTAKFQDLHIVSKRSPVKLFLDRRIRFLNLMLKSYT